MTEKNQIFREKQKFFDLWARTYDLIPTTIFYQTIHRRLLSYVVLPSPCLVLDVGCGTGKLLNLLAARYPQLKGIGLDLSPEMLKQARKANRHHPRLIFVGGNAENLPFADNQFDAVFNTISFLHYPNPEAVFQEVARVLKPGGYFYLADYIAKETQNTVSISPGKIRFYSAKKREEMATSSGLLTVSHPYLFANVVLSIFHKNHWFKN
ncbi:MAG: class I SAM-dependent methyltransferase [Geminocystis sp.]|nr:class I SAM-dependent methyltransferase [Geminocystis sp.]HIK37046.1 class I SAM-dependent methyltransferase [Geminocystis sp. M7585_C2015_104]MCS7147294.1 class I SAM-dependent methyltransferase [Geminocystis sp.]MCX8078822.1 class I SAM-dependent methyltransferase [Geminocystis sp.]MDW8116293.1 class I SAM-dependent methyltransferase [Geminocystis sp.]